MSFPTSPDAKAASVSRPKSEDSLMRNKDNCITCRVRQKKCTGIQPGDISCGDCSRLNIQCLGVQHNRPDWLRNPDAVKETRYRIKRHLTEYPVPRGRGLAPSRPFLDFYDLIERYSPRIPGSETLNPLSVQSGQLYQMESELSTYSQSGSYGEEMLGHGVYMDQPVMAYHDLPYAPEFRYGNMLHAPHTAPYHRQDSGSLFLGTPKTAQFDYDLQDYNGPGVHRQY
ncbi:hypothetical protein BDV93DRAFT_589588 [Ceratobasidium sp. AG-I]|nr:hypothetical protein BDV93DRAFT_589588 [Ceratobasidium sp. AG-I]